MDCNELLATFGWRAGVLPVMWAEGEGGGDAGMFDGGDAGGGDDFTEDDLGDDLDGGEGQGEGEGHENGQGGQEQGKADGRRGSKEFRDALKAWEGTPEGAKFAKSARDNHFRMEELMKLDPAGVTGVREKYALIEAAGGVEGLTTLQERVASTEAMDAALIAGDPKALDNLGKDFDPGLAKLAGPILDRVMNADPAAYGAAILPHLMGALMQSTLVGDLNKMIDVFGAAHLDDKSKLDLLKQALGRVGGWFDANEKKVGELKKAPEAAGQSKLAEERASFEKQQQDAHWNQSIIPGIGKMESAKFDALLKPLVSRLKLTPEQKTAALRDFRGKLAASCKADPAYGKQIKIYRGQKNPDPATVTNFVRSHLVKKAQAAFDAVKKERGWDGAAGTRKVTTGGQPGARGTEQRPGAGVTLIDKAAFDRSQVDWRATSEADSWKGLYTLKGGKKVQIRKAA